jgi:hypothetical protein
MPPKPDSLSSKAYGPKISYKINILIINILTSWHPAGNVYGTDPVAKKAAGPHPKKEKT